MKEAYRMHCEINRSCSDVLASRYALDRQARNLVKLQAILKRALTHAGTDAFDVIHRGPRFRQHAAVLRGSFALSHFSCTRCSGSQLGIDGGASLEISSTRRPRARRSDHRRDFTSLFTPCGAHPMTCGTKPAV